VLYQFEKPDNSDEDNEKEPIIYGKGKTITFGKRFIGNVYEILQQIEKEKLNM
jgi:hypothetical protein